MFGELKLKNKLAFVVGGSGLIGSEVVSLFLKSNVKVVNLDLKPRKIKKNTHLKEYFQKFHE